MTDREVDKAIEVGEAMARMVFSKRERKGQKRIEIHVGEQELAVLLGAAYRMGFEKCEEG